MPTTRRTRAMGYSPGGPKALDINAPTRQPRKVKEVAVPKNAPAPATRTTRARPLPKRKNEDTTVEQPPPKKLRTTKTTEVSMVIASDSQPSTTLPNGKGEHLSESTSSSQEEDPIRETELTVEPRVNAQQPTPPLDPPTDTDAVQVATKAPRANKHEEIALTKAQSQLNKKKKNDKRISDMIRHYNTMRHEEVEEEDEKALSECDDEEWEQRYSIVMEEAKNPTPFISSPSSKSEWEKWVPGSSAMFVVRETKQNEEDTRSKNGPRMHPLISNSGSFTTISHLAKLGPRTLTDVDTIVAISASLDWYEKNPSITAPSAAEVTVMLDNYARAKSAQQSETTAHVTSTNPRIPSSDIPKTPKPRVTAEDFLEAQRLSESNLDHSNNDGQKEQDLEHNQVYSANVQDRVEIAEPQTPHQQHGPPGPRTWSSALSASGIGNVILTPLSKLFSRSDRNRRDRASAEGRRVDPRPNMTQPVKADPKAVPQVTPAQSSKTMPAESISTPNLGPSLASDSFTPTASQPRRGRPDSHLPVHLRGVLFEDLPPEWQAVSQHLKKPQIDHVEEEIDDPVDMEYLLATARRTRKERERKELQAQAELIAQKQRELDSDTEDPVKPTDRNEKKRVTFSPEKTYSAKLGHSTFGLPLNIDDDSSEDEPEQLGPRTHFGRNSRPMKSCLKRSYREPILEDDNEVNGEDESGPRPAKKARFDDFASSQGSDILEINNDRPWRTEASESFLYDDDPYRARPFSRFISIPPSELRRAEAAQREYERLNPRSRITGFNSQSKSKSHDHVNNDDSSKLSINEYINSSTSWHKMFKTGTHITATASKSKLYGSSARGKHVQLDKKPVALKEASKARLNEQREDATKYKPKVSTGLHVGHILSPAKEKPWFENMKLDDAVLQSIALLHDDEILAESFGAPPEHVEATVEREASKAIEQAKRHERETNSGRTQKNGFVKEGEQAAEAVGPLPIEYPTWFDKAAEAREARKTEESAKAAEATKTARTEYLTWFDRAAEAREAQKSALDGEEEL